MADFTPASAAELKALKLLDILQSQVRRLDNRLTTKWARVRIAQTLKAVRPMKSAADLKWHAEVTAREADALFAIARAKKARPVFAKTLTRLLLRVRGGLD